MTLKIITILVLIGLAALLLLNLFYVLVVRYNDQEEEIRRGSKVKNKYDIVAFGSSYCRYAFDFSETGMTGYNFGIVAQFLYYTDLMIRSFRKCYRRNSLILILLPCLVFGEPGKGKYGASRYVRFVDKRLLGDEYSIKNLLFQKYFPLFVPSPSNLIKCLKRIFSYTPKNEYRSLEHNQLSMDEIKEQANRRCNDWCKEFNLKNTTTADVPAELNNLFEESAKILEGIIDYCMDEGLRPVLVIAPASSVMQQYCTKEFLEKVLYSNIKKGNKKNIPVLDYYTDERFCDVDLYANNADFLNARGRRLFTKAVVDDLIKIYD